MWERICAITHTCIMGLVPSSLLHVHPTFGRHTGQLHNSGETKRTLILTSRR